MAATLESSSFPSALQVAHPSGALSTAQSQPQSQSTSSSSSPSSSVQHSLAATTSAQKAYEEHLAGLRHQSRLHSQSHGGNPPPFVYPSTLSAHEMLAAQQHFGFSPMQQQQQQQQSHGGEADGMGSGAWQDDQEQFLRNLLSTPLDGSPISVSGGSYVSQSPPHLNPSSAASGDEAGRYSSLSPSSSSGFQSLHEFIHGNSISSGSSNTNNAGFPTPPGNDVHAPHMGQIKQEQVPSSFGYVAQAPSVLDQGAIDFFVKSMSNPNNPPQLLPMMHPHMHMHGTQGMEMGTVPMHQQQQQQHTHNPVIQSFAPDGQQFHFQAHHNVPTDFPGMFEQHSAPDSRKRSAPTPSTSATPMHEPGPVPQSNAKRPRKSSSEKVVPRPAQPASQQVNGLPSATSFMPRMEVGSNATALAAIERLKAKKRAAAEEESKQAAFKTDAAGRAKGGLQSNGTNGPATGVKHEKKVAHNAIERRYRNNINARIAALRNAVPALRELRPKRPTRKGKEAPPEDLVDGVPAATKLNKATILGKATEYIRYLKGRETRLVSEVAGLRELIRSLEGGEELLELWQGEMERVVAEQEAIAKAAFAMEDDSLDYGDEDEDEEEEDEADQQKPSRSPSNASSTRYMMGIFMGFSVLGGGAEVLHNEHASSASAAEHAHNVLRASSGRVIGASHQLLKRSMHATNVKIGSVAHDPHHFDHVANHLLVVEVLRGLALVACLAFIFWPVIARFLPTGKLHGKGRRSARKAYDEDEKAIGLRRKVMLATLANPASNPHQTDRAMRQFVRAPQGALTGAVSLATLTVSEAAYRIGLDARVKSTHEEERAAIWCRLLELETSMGPLAQRSLLARLHTLATVSCLPAIGYGSQSASPLLHPSRVFGTIAIAMVRASSGNFAVTALAERFWTMARRCRLLAFDEGVDENSVTEATDRWLDPVLELSLVDAVGLCPAPTSVASTFAPQADAAARATMVSPLLCIAASQHGRQLSAVWTTLLCQIVRTTCPSQITSEGDNRSPTCADFIKHHSDAEIVLPLLSDTADRDRLTSQITRLTLTAPRCPRLQIICNITFGSCALLLGNSAVAQSVAVALLRAAQQDTVVMPACATSFVSLVLGEQQGSIIAASADIAKGAALDEVDALAASSLSWLSFLRILSAHLSDSNNKSTSDASAIAQSAVAIRRLLAAARAVKPAGSDELLAELAASFSDQRRLDNHRDSVTSTTSSTPSIALSEDGSGATMLSSPSSSRIAQRNLDDALDTLTDVLAVLGRRAAMGGEFSKEKLLQADENIDSGVEWAI